jgi:hypothetical protein
MILQKAERVMAYTETQEAKERLKYCAYRHCWPRRNKLTPSAERRRGENGTTWGRWFESRYCKPGESIEAYHAVQQARATAEQRVAREKALRARAGILESLEG